MMGKSWNAYDWVLLAGIVCGFVLFSGHLVWLSLSHDREKKSYMIYFPSTNESASQTWGISYSSPICGEGNTLRRRGRG